MHKGFLKTAAILAAISVALGAFAAHSLKGNFSANAIEIFETAVRYQFYHVFALFLAGIVYKEFTNKFVKISGKLFMLGLLLFSGSLYAMSVVKAMVLPGFSWLGPVTPIGGLCFIAGWICLFIGFFKPNNPSEKSI